MKNLALIVGACGALAISAWACGSDVENNPGGGGTTGSGGSGGTATGTATGTGGTGTGTATGTSTGTSTGMMNCDGPFTNICGEACCIAEVQCGVSGACGLASQFGIDLTSCSDTVATCAADCIIDANDQGDPCPDILALTNLDFNTPLGQCLQACQQTTPCQDCVTQSCGTELDACINDADNTCQAYAQCLVNCGANDSACLTGCGDTHGGDTEVDALEACLTTNCAEDCLSGQGGGGGMGGAGGAGGAGGSGGN